MITEQNITDLNNTGYTIVKNVLNKTQCAALISDYNSDDHYRKKIMMERYRFGSGEYKYFRYPLPDMVAGIREKVYPFLVPVANSWMQALGLPTRYPATHAEFREICKTQSQDKPAVLILKYGKGGFNTLHQDLYGDVYFPMQIVLFLNQPGEDHTGGQFVMTEQIPRAQSKAIVLQPEQGNMLVFTTNYRPVKGSRDITA